jgi:hypothetical protein
MFVTWPVAWRVASPVARLVTWRVASPVARCVSRVSPWCQSGVTWTSRAYPEPRVNLALERWFSIKELSAFSEKKSRPAGEGEARVLPKNERASVIQMWQGKALHLMHSSANKKRRKAANRLTVNALFCKRGFTNVNLNINYLLINHLYK